MPDLDALRELHAWMRESGVLYARCGEFELRLDPVPAPSPALVPMTPSSPEDDERRSLEELLYSSGVDPTPFLEARRAKVA